MTNTNETRDMNRDPITGAPGSTRWVLAWGALAVR